MNGSCAQDVQGIFERIGIVTDIESLRIFDENGKVTKSADKLEVGLTIEDIGLEIFKAGVPSTPYRGGHGYNAFCMVRRSATPPRRTCHVTETEVLSIFELCLSMKTDEKVAKNRAFSPAPRSRPSRCQLRDQGSSRSRSIVRSCTVQAMRRAEGGDLSALAGARQLGSLAQPQLDDRAPRRHPARVERFHTEQLIRRAAWRARRAGGGVAHEIKTRQRHLRGDQVLADDFEGRPAPRDHRPDPAPERAHGQDDPRPAQLRAAAHRRPSGRDQQISTGRASSRCRTRRTKVRCTRLRRRAAPDDDGKHLEQPS
jgi:hypothetical protein